LVIVWVTAYNGPMLIKNGHESVLKAAEIVKHGGVIGFRTDTFYGLGADPFNPTAIKHIKNLKGRDEGKPILVIASDKLIIDRLVAEKTSNFDLLSSYYWPGPLTLVVRARPEVPEELTAGTATVGIRFPDDEEVVNLVSACGGLLTATSANLSGMSPACTAQEVHEAFMDKLPLIIDGGPAHTDRPSTVVDVSGPEIKLIREGIILWEDIKSKTS
jgi:L-threonylcarbamoyladenylate synthase